MTISPLFDPAEWAEAEPGYDDITVHRSRDGRIARIAFDRPEVRNAFRPHTVDELYRALDAARQDSRIGVVLLTGNGPSEKDGGWAAGARRVDRAGRLPLGVPVAVAAADALVAAGAERPAAVTR